jgi:glycosyltransferase involved in cell wall biosynthesis
MKVSVWSNMYPSEIFPYYGTFVKSVVAGWERECSEESVKVIAIEGKPNTSGEKVYFYLKLYIRCLNDLLFRCPDIIEIHYPSHFLLLLLFVRRRRVILRFHGSDLEKIAKYSVAKQALRYLENRIVCAVAPSQYYKKRIAEELRFGGKVIVINPDAVDELFYSKELFHRVETIGYVGRLDEDKNVQELLQAYSLFGNRKSMRLIIVGSGPYESNLINLARELKISDYVEFRGAVARDELVDIYNMFSVFIFPSRRTAESFGLVGLEALACGVPVIYRKSLEGPLEYLNSNNSLAYNNSPEALSQVLTEYFQIDLTGRKDMCDQALQTAAKFNTVAIVDGGIKRILGLHGKSSSHSKV